MGPSDDRRSIEQVLLTTLGVGVGLSIKPQRPIGPTVVARRDDGPSQARRRPVRAV